MVDVSPLALVHASLSLVYVLISLVLISIILAKFIKYRMKGLLLVGIALIGLTSPWIPDSVTLLTILLTGSSYSDAFYSDLNLLSIILTTVISPLAILAWLTAILSLLKIEKKRMVLLISSLIFLVFDAIFLILLFIDVENVVVFHGIFDYQWSLFTTIYYLSVTVLILVTGGKFTQECLKTDSNEIKLKGKLLLIAFISFSIGVFIPYILYNIIALIIARLFLVIASIMFYLGFILPEWLKNKLLKERDIPIP